jgi:hypothetical protein
MKLTDNKEKLILRCDHPNWGDWGQNGGGWCSDGWSDRAGLKLHQNKYNFK